MTKPTLVKLPTIKSNGCLLNVIESSKQCDFRIKRQYFLQTFYKKTNRGNHSHKNLKQLLICLIGQTIINLEGADGNYTFDLSRINKALFIPPNYWREIIIYPNTILSVLASEEYNENDYIRDYKSFKKNLKK